MKTVRTKTSVIHLGDCLEVLPALPENSVHVCVTSPPYFGLRDYKTGRWRGGDSDCVHTTSLPRGGRGGTGAMDKRTVGAFPEGIADKVCKKCGAVREDRQIGLEASPAEFVRAMVEVFRGVKRVLRDDGTLWLNLGDSFAGSGKGGNPEGSAWSGYVGRVGKEDSSKVGKGKFVPEGTKEKDLMGVPWMVAEALKADGWYLRAEMIWCLSGGTWLYARSKKGDMPMTVKDLARLDPSTVKLWNGDKWTSLVGMSKTSRSADELEIVLRSGERISCTPTHRFPTDRGLIQASEIGVGDKLVRCRLPEPDSPKTPEHVGVDAAWFAGLYVAEGSQSGDTITLAGHAREVERWERVRRITEAYGGSAKLSVDGNKQVIHVHGKMMFAILNLLVTGRVAKDKGFSPIVWRYSDEFLESLLDGYLDGDGHWDEKNGRWRIGFTRNYNLERDLRTACARLGYRLTLNLSSTTFQGKTWPTFLGEIRKTRSGHHNCKDTCEVVEVRKSRCREVYDLEVEDDPHLFALASGVLTHNSKLSAMPESVSGWRWERCQKKVAPSRRAKENSKHAQASSNGSHGARKGSQFDSQSEWEDCSGCKKCEKNDGLVLRRGSWRPTRAHEVIFLFAKSPRYFCDGDAVRTPLAASTVGRDRYSRVLDDPDEQFAVKHDHETVSSQAGANLRDVVTFKGEPLKEDHYAAFPSGLPKLAIRAGTSQRGVCPTCGAPWCRVVDRNRVYHHTTSADGKSKSGPYSGQTGAGSGTHDVRHGVMNDVKTLGWRPTCGCPEHDPVPATVLDPFMGSGTSSVAAAKLGRHSVGVELNPEFLKIAEKRVRKAERGRGFGFER